MPMVTRRRFSRTVTLRVAVLALATVALAGCDKCGNRIKLNAPSLPSACGDNADPAR